MNCRISFVCVCLFILPLCRVGGGLQAQNLQDEFDDYLAAITGEFYAYLDSIDLEFARLLEDEWQEYIVYEGTPPPMYSRSHTTFAPVVPQKPVVAADRLPETTTFYGQPVTLPAMQPPVFTVGSLSEKQVADAWRTLFRYDFTTLLSGVNRYCHSLSLNDWGKYQLIRHVVDTRFLSGSPHERTVLLSYLLIHAGVDVKMAFAAQGLVLLLPLKEEVYQTAFVRLGDAKYYLLDSPFGSVKSIFASAHAYPGEVQPVSLEIARPLAFAYDRHLIDLYGTWPLCDLSVYFRSRPSRSFRKKMDDVFGKDLAGKSPLEQVALLLDGVQQTVAHIPDADLHGKEVYYFPEETVFHRQADCEDLSVLLDWLIRTYTSCRTVALLYQDHVAVAIEAPAGYAGQVLTHRDIQYIICDPSYKGAPMGEVVPANNAVRPRVVSYH